MTRPSDLSSGRASPLEPLAFDAPGSVQRDRIYANNSEVPSRSILTVSQGAPWWHSQFNLMLCAFGLLALAAILFVLLAPPPSTSSSPSIMVTSDGKTQVTKPTIEVAPWNESRRTQARSDSQDILSDLLLVKKQLEAKQVEQWAPDRYQAALDQAQSGDDFYARQNFADAIDNYQRALDQMDTLLTRIPQILHSKIVQGQASINAGKADLARQEFQQALALDRNSIDALKGLDRANNLEQSLSILESALTDEQAYISSRDLAALQAAANKYQQVVALDGQLERANVGLARVQILLTEHEYKSHMSKGFVALFDGRSSTAKASFSKALEVKPGDSVASTVYRQSLAADSRSSLGSIMSAAKRYETQERWANAISNYQVALQRDANQISAKLGLIRSQARGKLDQQLKSVLSDPLALSRENQKGAATNVLRDARAIGKKGPVLKKQIAQIENTFKQLDSTIKVTFKSDQLTNISLSKAGSRSINLGRFTNKDLALKPGRYVVEGVRLGFQDVRQEVDITPGRPQAMEIEIVCKQAINATASASSSQQ